MSAMQRHWTFRTQRIAGANGLWYRLECRCFVCRQATGLLCENILCFIRSKPTYAKFVLVREAAEEGDDSKLSPEQEAAHHEAVKDIAQKHGFPLSDWQPRAVSGAKENNGQ